MIDVKKLLGSQEGTAWIPFGDTTWELELRYIGKRKVGEILKLPEKEHDDAFLHYTVKGWRGLTPAVLGTLTKVDEAEMKAVAEAGNLHKEIPFNYELFEYLLGEVIGVREFIDVMAISHKKFQPDDWEDQLKNSESGPAGSSDHEEKPAGSA